MFFLLALLLSPTSHLQPALINLIIGLIARRCVSINNTASMSCSSCADRTSYHLLAKREERKKAEREEIDDEIWRSEKKNNPDTDSDWRRGSPFLSFFVFSSIPDDWFVAPWILNDVVVVPKWILFCKSFLNETWTYRIQGKSTLRHWFEARNYAGEKHVLTVNLKRKIQRLSMKIFATPGTKELDSSSKSVRNEHWDTKSRSVSEGRKGEEGLVLQIIHEEI